MWTVQATEPASTTFPELASVSCSAATACTAVGNDFGAPLVERLSGSSWSIQSTPITRPLYGVACVAATTCVATGGLEAPGGS
jgi:hypothetical protein